MDNKINLKTTRVLTIPLSFTKDIKDLYSLVEDNWNDCYALDNFSELLRDIIAGNHYCNYLETEINYAEDRTKDE